MSRLDHAASEWLDVGTPAPTALTPTRLVAHWASQLASAPGTTLGAKQADDSHTNLSWIPGIGALAGIPVGKESVRGGLRLADLTLVLLDQTGSEVVAERALDGITLEEALAWLGRELSSRGVGVGALSLPKHPDMPEHPAGNGAALGGADPAAQQELARWFGNAAMMIQAVAQTLGKASPVRCWPHHFDIATLITLREKSGDAGMHSIGVGLSPGDGGIGEPYFYVTPWPYPETTKLLPLPAGGTWHTEGWVGAVLRGSAIAERPAGQQGRSVADFLKAAIGACHGLLGYPVAGL